MGPVCPGMPLAPSLPARPWNREDKQSIWKKRQLTTPSGSSFPASQAEDGDHGKHPGQGRLSSIIRLDRGPRSNSPGPCHSTDQQIRIQCLSHYDLPWSLVPPVLLGLGRMMGFGRPSTESSICGSRDKLFATTGKKIKDQRFMETI